MRRGKGRRRDIRIIGFACAAFLCCCGGGGSGGVDVTPPTTNLEFVLGPPRAPTAPLTATGPDFRVTLASDPPANELPLIRGTWDEVTQNGTIVGNPDNVILWADTATQEGLPLFGNLSVVASQTVRWTSGANPTAGQFLIMSRDGFFTGRIRAGVTVQGGIAGVLAEYDAGNDGTYEQSAFSSWADFRDLWKDGASPLYRRVSSFVFHTRQAAFSVMDLSIEATLFVEDLRADLLAAGSDNAILLDCDTLAGAPGQPGSLSVVWTDANGNGQIDYDFNGAKDTFTFTLDQCWIDDPSDTEDFLMDGVMRLTYYEPPLQWGPEFDALTMTQVLNGAMVQGTETSYSGGFSLIMVTPAN